MQLLCSTGTFSRDPDYTSHKAILTYGSQIVADGFEVLFYPDWYASYDRVVADLQNSHLVFPAIHSEKNIGVAFGSDDPVEQEKGLRWLEINCDFAQKIGARLVVLHLWGWPQSDDFWNATCDHWHAL